MSLNELKSRNHKILEAIILAYADSAIPVGSEFLRGQNDFGVSPATIRNVMAELETQGLITHPHTSAGRVPTDLGYRYYVDVLMEPKRVSFEEEKQVEELSRLKIEDPLELLDKAAHLLAEITQEAGVVLVPQLAQGSFRQFKLIPVGDQEILGVLIASEGMVRHAMLELDEIFEDDLLGQVERFLNQELAGMPLDKVTAYLEQILLAAHDDVSQLYRHAIQLFQLESFFEEEPAVILDGTQRIFEAPEFQDLERTRRLLRGLENKEELVDILRRDVAADDVKLHIGLENRGTHLTDCTIAAASYRLRDGVTGAIGVIGPTRMNYPRVTALVKRVAEAVSRSSQERD